MLVVFPPATVKKRLSPAQRNTLECEPAPGIVISAAQEQQIGWRAERRGEEVLIGFATARCVFNLTPQREEIPNDCISRPRNNRAAMEFLSGIFHLIFLGCRKPQMRCGGAAD